MNRLCSTIRIDIIGLLRELTLKLVPLHPRLSLVVYLEFLVLSPLAIRLFFLKKARGEQFYSYVTKTKKSYLGIT